MLLRTNLVARAILAPHAWASAQPAELRLPSGLACVTGRADRSKGLSTEAGKV